VQSVGHFPINLQELSVDFLSASAHKFHGPKGVGLLFVRQGIRLHPFIDGGGQERSMRGGTESVHNIAGMALALELAEKEYAERSTYILGLKDYFKARLLELHPAIKINGDPEHTSYSVLSVSFPAGPKSELLLMQLDIAGISASGGSACTSGAEQESHVLAGIKHPADRKTIRFSFSHLNTFEELDQTIRLLQSWFPVLVA
jgi:cysteine desulfurase